jgi:hypothetical protein
MSSAITGVDEKPTARFGTMIQAISSGFPTDSEAFDPYVKDRIILYLQDHGSVAD